MKVLFFLIFLMTVSVCSASDEVIDLPFHTFLDGEKWLSPQRVYNINVDGVPQAVRVKCKWQSSTAGRVTVTNLESQDRLVIHLDLTPDVVQAGTRIRFNNGSEIIISSRIVVGEEHPTEPTCGVGQVDITATAPQVSIPWKCATPSPVCSVRPQTYGIINGDVDALDITQYLFYSVERGKGYFVRMEVRYRDLSTVNFEWGKELYYGRTTHHDPKTNIVGSQSITLPRPHERVIQ